MFFMVLGVGCWVLGVGCWVLGVGCLLKPPPEAFEVFTEVFDGLSLEVVEVGVVEVECFKLDVEGILKIRQSFMINESFADAASGVENDQPFQDFVHGIGCWVLGVGCWVGPLQSHLFEG